MIQFLSLDEFVRGLKPIISTEIFTRTGEFTDEGLFSEAIFGPIDSLERKTTFSFIDLNAYVVHPSAFKVLKQLDRRIEKFISTEQLFVLDEKGMLEISDDGITGITEFMKMFPKIKFRGGTATREKLIEVVKKAYDSKTIFISKIPVIPPDQRPIFQDEKGQWINDPLNDYYLNILRKSLQMRTSVKSGPLFDLLNYELQRAIISHDDFIRTLIQKKRGIIRSQLLGKRTDFSGRAVITPSPDLKVNEIGIPLRLGASIFEPFIIHRLLYSSQVDKEELEKEVKSFTGLDLSVDSVKRVLKSIKADDKIPKRLYEIFFEATEVAILGRVVLAKRDPVLHAESVRAFKVKLIDGNTMQLCTLQVSGFNADFDGDTMAVFHPLTAEAQEEAKTKMLRTESGESSDAVTFSLSKEMCVGLFMITKDIKRAKSPISVSDEDLDKATDPYIPVKYRGVNTTMGKAILNSCFPPRFPFFDKQATRSNINSLIPQVLEKYGQDVAIETFSKLERVGFKFSTIMAPSFSLENVELPSEISVLKQQLVGATPEEADALLQRMKVILVKHLKGTGIYDLTESGASRGWDPIMQILVSKGIIADPQGNILDPIKGSFSDGLSNKEYFSASSGARKGIIDRVINTADTGYSSRKLAFVLNSVEIHHQLKDCGTDRTLTLKLIKDSISRLTGRFIIRGRSVIEFKEREHKIGETINLRSPIYCKSPKLCHTCYGKLLARHKTPYAGILAAQVIGERGTQLILTTFHKGGAVKLEIRNVLQDLAENDPIIDVSRLSRYLSQTENQLVCKKPCKVTINVSEYTKGDDFQIYESYIWLKSLIAKVEFEDLVFSLVLDYPVELQIRRMAEIGKEFIELSYDSNVVILEVPLATTETQQQVQYVERLLGGREIHKDVDHLFKKLLNVYKPPIANMDLVHLEVLLGQVLRDKNIPSLPARLGRTWNPVMMNIKDIVFNTSFIQGLGFENINKAIQTGLISEEAPDTSILEKVLTGTLVEKET